jgi:hypothetical protein
MSKLPDSNPQMNVRQAPAGSGGGSIVGKTTGGGDALRADLDRASGDRAHMPLHGLRPSGK